MSNFAWTDQTSHSPPWEKSSSGLLSLFEMLTFYAEAFVKGLSAIQRLYHCGPMYKGEDTQWVNDTLKALNDLKEQCRAMNFDSLVAQIERTERAVQISPLIESAGKGTIADMRAMTNPRLDEIVEAAKYELSRHLFLHVSNDRQSWYSEENKPLFGEQVAAVFDEASHDIAEAGRCFALERWDACAHHLVLATEVAMRQWAKSFKIKPKHPIELSDWSQILQAAEKELLRLQNAKRTVRRDKTQKQLAETTAHFRSINDAWRKYTAHGREKFTDRTAKNLMNHVEAFMRNLAEI